MDEKQGKMHGGEFGRIQAISAGGEGGSLSPEQKQKLAHAKSTMEQNKYGAGVDDRADDPREIIIEEGKFRELGNTSDEEPDR